MYYEINVSLHGQHYFATAERSVGTMAKAMLLVTEFRRFYKVEDGFSVTVRECKQISTPINV